MRDIVDNLATAVVARQHLSLGLHHAIVHSLLVWMLGSDASLVPSRSVARRGLYAVANLELRLRADSGCRETNTIKIRLHTQ